MNRSRNFVMLVSSSGHWKDSWLYLCTTAYLANFHAAIKGANNGFFMNILYFLIQISTRPSHSPMQNKQWRNIYRTPVICSASLPEVLSEAIYHPAVSTGVGCWSDKLAWIKCQPWSRFTLTEATVNLFIWGQVRQSGAGSTFGTKSFGMGRQFNRQSEWRRHILVHR